VFYTDIDDATAETLKFFCEKSNQQVLIRPWVLPRRALMCRAYGRDLAAKATPADAVWFTDADYCFGDGCLDTLIATVPTRTEKLFCPARIMTHKTHALGDEAIKAIESGSQVIDINPDDFGSLRCRRAFGGVQITRGPIAREFGYCHGSRRKINRSDNWINTVEDRTYRLILGENGTSIPIPNVYRLRHSRAGRFDASTTN